MNIYYIYFYLREDFTPYYVGKGKGRRAWAKNHTVNLPSNKSRIVIVHNNLSEIYSLILERYYIRWFGRKDNNTGILRNQTDGGEGFDSKTSKTVQQKRLKNNRHNFQKRLDGSSISSDMVKNGTHNFLILKGENNPKYDNTIHNFKHKSGETYSGTKYKFYKKYNLFQSKVSELVNGKVKSVKGWFIL